MRKAKRFVALGLALVMSIMTLVGCSKGESAGQAANATEEDGA